MDRQQIGVDPAVLAVLGDGERRQRMRGMTPGQRNRVRRDEERSKATYDLPVEVIEAIKDLAAEADCSASSLVAYLLVEGIEAYRRGEISVEEHLRPSRSPRFLWVVEVPELDGDQGVRE